MVAGTWAECMMLGVQNVRCSVHTDQQWSSAGAHLKPAWPNPPMVVIPGKLVRNCTSINTVSFSITWEKHGEKEGSCLSLWVCDFYFYFLIFNWLINFCDSASTPALRGSKIAGEFLRGGLPCHEGISSSSPWSYWEGCWERFSLDSVANWTPGRMI